MKKIKEEILALKQDHTHGASYLAIKAIELIRKSALLIDVPDKTNFIEAMNFLAAELKLLRPSMISIHNLVSDYIENLNNNANNIPDLENLRQKAVFIADNIINQTLADRKSVIQKGAQLIRNNSTLMTCSYSSTVVEIIKKAHEAGKKFDIIIARSFSHYSTLAYGQIMAEKIALPLNINIISDETIAEHLIQADYVIIGADAVLKDGSIINGFPSLKIAEKAFMYNIPFYVVCEPHKIARETLIPQLEAGFELIPNQLITSIITGL